MLDTAISAVRIILIVYIAFGLLVYLRQGHFVFVPSKSVSNTPAYLKIPFQEVTLRTTDNESIAAWFIPCDSTSEFTGGKGAENAPTVLFCHGNAGNIGDRLESIATFHGMGLNVLIFDYHGYGNSTGKPTEKNTYRGGEAAWNYLVGEKRVSPGRIILFGRSLGGGIASWLAEKHNPAILIMESTFSSAPDMAAQMFPFLPSRLVCQFKYDTRARMRHITCPLIVSHSKEDKTIPFSQAERIFEAANEPKTFIELHGPHNAGGIDVEPDFRKTTRDYIRTYIIDAKPRASNGSSNSLSADSEIIREN